MKIVNKYRKIEKTRRMRKAIRKSLAAVPNKRKLSKESLKKAKSFWKELTGANISTDWHSYFYARNGMDDHRYVPSDLYYESLIGKFGHFPFNGAYTDKNLTDIIMDRIRQPKTIIKNARGYFYADHECVSREEAIRICSELEGAIIKPSCASHGEGVRKFSSANGKTSVEGMSVVDLFDLYGENFIVQEALKQHHTMSALNPSSVNTIRILTYRNTVSVRVCYAVVRIGREGKEVDNETAGGISARIEANGRLAKYAYGLSSEGAFEKTDSGIRLEGYVIPSYEKAIEAVKIQHTTMPYFDLIGWDICIDEQGDPVMIEWNTFPELSQTANGPAFGDLTEEIVREVWPRFNTRNGHWG